MNRLNIIGEQIHSLSHEQSVTLNSANTMKLPSARLSGALMSSINKNVNLSNLHFSKTMTTPYQQSPSTSSSQSNRTFGNIAPKEATAIHSLLSEKAASQLKISNFQNGLLLIQLNRPKQLHALTEPMVTALGNLFAQARIDSDCKIVLLTSEGEKAFCAGGDVREVSRAHHDEAIQFFSNEYRMDYLVSRMQKPVISFWSGIVMGGGVGLSIFGSHRIATEKTIFAMPETTIGLFPDVGASHFLTKLPKGIGMYLGLTGMRINTKDLLHLGLATHFVPLCNLSALQNELQQIVLSSSSTTHESIERILRKFTVTDPLDAMEPQISPTLEENIQQYFGDEPQFHVMLERLKSNIQNPFCDETLKMLRQKCPLSCGVWMELYRQAKSLNLLDSLRLDFKLVQSFVKLDTNFIEGVRALLVDKDNLPHWNPACLEDVTAPMIQRLFNNPDAIPLDSKTSIPPP
uniref:3-hydroxyisobutyryl-CoA hydrolase n=1 Tax=Nephromyces sp. MMRI TaxID=2496275 RepID=A0A3Q8UC44_9APIC|nr:3-hydroxyisobutyryl-coenzyme A hydrolase / CoA-thioester hydrolase [Nephromyces sp. MMRI]